MNSSTPFPQSKSTELGTYFIVSLIITLILFSLEGDFPLKRGIFTYDNIVSILVFISFFFAAQFGLSRILGNRIDGLKKTAICSIGGIASIFALIFIYGSVLFWVKF